MKKQVYVYLYPSDMDAENPQNYHVIEGWYDNVTNTYTFSKDRRALDGKFKIEIHPNIVDEQRHPHDEAHMRFFLAEEQNSGREVCANCVKRFYADTGNA